MKRILILGGTGAMGTSLASILERDCNNLIEVTSRSERGNTSNKRYLKGNAHDLLFLNEILANSYYDAIIDFMFYKSDDFKKRIDLLLQKTNQYFCISSARVYAECSGLLTENSPRLSETINDISYIKGNDYSIEKCKVEDILRTHKNKNWTVIRPYITYNTTRLQLGIDELDDWFYRIIKNRKILISKRIAFTETTLTYGYDVARGIASLIGQKDSLGEVFHITSTNTITWKEVLQIYANEIKQVWGKDIKIQITENDIFSHFGMKEFQVVYDRIFTRRFDNSKISRYIDPESFVAPQEGLKKCINEYLKLQTRDLKVNWYKQALMDRISGDKAAKEEFQCEKDWLLYSNLVYFGYKHRFKILLYKLLGKNIL